MKMCEKQISDYFIVSGVPYENRKYETVYQSTVDPITEITVINKDKFEPVPDGFKCIEKTPLGHEANLNHGSIQGSKFFICYKRGRGRPPLLDIGVYHSDSKEKISSEYNIIKKTNSGFSANLNNVGSAKIYLIYRRSDKKTPYNQLVVSDICVILTSKNESPPHAFCLIEKNLNKGYFGFGSDAFLCYKKSMDRPPHLLYNPAIIDRYPYEENPQYPLPANLPLFCLPMCASIECWPKNDHLNPAFSTFILTSNLGQKIYGTVMNFYEEIAPSMLTDEELIKIGFVEGMDEENLEKALKKNCLQRIKSLCILSQWPFFDQFKSFLSFIYHNFIVKQSTIPVEYYISFFMKNIPFPSLDQPNILVNLGQKDEEILFSQFMEDCPIPPNGASFKRLLQNLGSENCMHLLLYMLTEQKILLYSLRLSILTELAEALVAMIFPFNWNCPYIPLCPLILSDVLSAPLPFIIGIHSQYFDRYPEAPSDVISIDVDTQAIHLSESKQGLNLRMFPKKEAKALKEKLDEILLQIETVAKSKEYDSNARKRLNKQFEVMIQEAFLHFMASILKNFHHFLKPITAAPKVGATDPSSLFAFDAFIKEHEANEEFYRQLTRTQMFTKFIEERSLVSDKNISLAFFDDCIEKVELYEKRNPAKRYSNFNLINFEDRAKPTKLIEFSSFIFESDHQSARSFDGRFNKELFLKFQNKLKSHLTVMGNTGGMRPVASFDNIDSAQLSGELQTYPFAKRAKHEVLKWQKIAQQSSNTPGEWAKFLLINAYSLWFTHYPCFSYTLLRLKLADNSVVKPIMTLSIAYQVLQRMQSMEFSVPDEFSYRILMIMCNIYCRPALAVKIFLDMKKYKVKLNAITYGYYNKAVLDGHWSIDRSCSKWSKILNVVRVVLHFRKYIHTETEMPTKDSKNKLIKWERNENGSVVVTTDHSSMAGLLWIHPDSIKRSTDSLKTVSGQLKRQKSDEIYSEISKDELNRVANDLMEIRNVFLEQKNKPQNWIANNSNKNYSKLLNKSENSSEKNIFPNSFVTPIKETLGNLDFIKSPVADKLISSYRIAKNFTRTGLGYARSTLYESEKNLNKTESFSKSDVHANNNGVRTTRMHRSSTLPQSLSSSPGLTGTMTPVNESPKSQLHGIVPPSDYFYLTVIKSLGGRFSELKQSLGTSNTDSPGKFNVVNAVASRLNFRNEDDISVCSIDNLLHAFDENSFHMEKYQNILNEYYEKPLDMVQEFHVKKNEIIWHIEMVSSAKCFKCNSIVYDEEIMSNWLPDDSDLNAKCLHCSEKKEESSSFVTFVPSLTIYIKDFRKNTDGYLLEPITVQYLSPMVLRKELENILNRESFSSLIIPKFVDDHPIVYWNLVWYFTRINLPSHLFGLAMSASTLNSGDIIQASEARGYDFRNVSVVCLWDDENFYESIPLHQKWLRIRNIPESQLDSAMLDFKKICQELIQLIEEKDLTRPIKYLISERNKLKKKSEHQGKEKRLNSIYRELAFLNMMQEPPALNIDLFDEIYLKAFESLTLKDKESLIPIDKPLPTEAIYCRNLFKPLSLISIRSTADITI